MKKAKGLAINNNILWKLQCLAGIDISIFTQPLGVGYIASRVRTACQQLRNLQRDHLALCQTHLTALAEARVLTKDSSVLQPAKLRTLNRRIEKEIRRIQRKESQAEIHRSVSLVLKPSSNRGSLSRVDIPLILNERLLTFNPDPATWEGPWDTISDPKLIVDHVCHANAKQYHQAHISPFGSEPLFSFLGH